MRSSLELQLLLSPVAQAPHDDDRASFLFETSETETSIAHRLLIPPI